MRQFIWLCLILITSVGNAQFRKDSLYVGLTAPPINVKEWILGKGESQLKADKIYVIDFGATWCGTCRGNAPYLLQLARKYKNQVSFISLFVWENNPNSTSLSYIDKVKAYVQEQMNDSGYMTIGVDGPCQTVANAWLKAAGITGLPSLFIVGKNKLIEWIGRPEYLDTIIHQVLQGSFHPSQMKKVYNNEDTVLNLIMKEYKSGNYRPALSSIDSLIDAVPEWTYYNVLKFRILFAYNRDAAYKFAKDLLTTKNLTANDYMGIVGEMLGHKDSRMDIAEVVINKAISINKSQLVTVDCYTKKAGVFEMEKRFDDAIHLLQSAINILGNYNDTASVRRIAILKRSIYHLQQEKLAQ